MKEGETACRVRRILKVIHTADGVVTGTIEGKTVEVRSVKAARGLLPGDEAVWDGARWVRLQSERGQGTDSTESGAAEDAE